MRRSVNLEIGQEEIEVLATGDLAVERFSQRPARNRTVQSGNVTISTDARGRVSTQHRKRRTKLHPFLRHGRSLPPGNPAVAAPWPYRAAFLGPPLCHCPSRPRKTPCRGSGERKRTPPCANPPYVTATPSRGPGERVGTPEVVHEVIRARIRPRAAVDFRWGVWHEKTPPEPSVLAHAGFWDSGLCLGTATPSRKRPRCPSTPGACQRSPFSNGLGQSRSPPGAPGRARQ